MSHVRHRSIIVTTYGPELARKARAKAKKIGLQVTNTLQSQVNNYFTFYVAPSGSKEGWEEQQLDAIQRGAFCEWIAEQMESDGSNLYEVLFVDSGKSEPRDFPPSATFIGQVPYSESPEGLAPAECRSCKTADINAGLIYHYCLACRKAKGMTWTLPEGE